MLLRYQLGAALMERRHDSVLARFKEQLIKRSMEVSGKKKTVEQFFNERSELAVLQIARCCPGHEVAYQPQLAVEVREDGPPTTTNYSLIILLETGCKSFPRRSRVHCATYDFFRRRPSALIESLRSVGYNASSGVAIG